jgi:AAA ATPase-like protein
MYWDVAPPPVGRAAELSLIARFLRESEDAGAALILSGEPGAGKTFLLDHAAEKAAASGIAVFRGRCVPSEADVAFGACWPKPDCPPRPGPRWRTRPRADRTDRDVAPALGGELAERRSGDHRRAYRLAGMRGASQHYPMTDADRDVPARGRGADFTQCPGRLGRYSPTGAVQRAATWGLAAAKPKTPPRRLPGRERCPGPTRHPRAASHPARGT